MPVDGRPEESWRVCSFKRIPQADMRLEELHDALLSRSEHGRIYWDVASPRSFVRGAVYTSEAKLVAHSQRTRGTNSDLVVATNPGELGQAERSEAKGNRSTGRWLYAGSWFPIFGHFITETLPALWPLLDDQRFDGVFAHLFNSHSTLPWQYELASLAIDKPVTVIDDSPAQADELIVPTRPYHYQSAISPLAAGVWDLVSDNAARAGERPDQPVFLSRSRFDSNRASAGIRTGREFANGDGIDDVFRSRGFAIIHPEDVSIQEQVLLARSATVLAGQSGSALHLSAFTKKGGRVMELGDSRTRDSINATQRAISSVKGQLIYHIPYAETGDGALDIDHLKSRLDLALASV